MTEPDQVSAYEALGGEPALMALVARFYDLMASEPAYTALMATHEADTSRARERLFAFLSGRLGGPDLYNQRYGHPRLRMRHQPFAIGPAERDQWVACMDQAMRETGVHELVRALLNEFFTMVAANMQNRD